MAQIWCSFRKKEVFLKVFLIQKFVDGYEAGDPVGRKVTSFVVTLAWQ